MSGIIGFAESKAPQAIQVFMEACRMPGSVKKLEDVLTNDVTMSAVGFIQGTLSAYKDATPSKVAALFKTIVFPEGVTVTGGMSDCKLTEGGKWTVTVLLNRKANNIRSNIEITAVCTLAKDLISNIEAEVDPC